MFYHAKKTILFSTALLLLSTCGRKHSDDESNTPPPAENELADPLNDKELRLRGYVELASIVESSMMTTRGQFTFESYLNRLTELLGVYSATPANPGWRNVSANTVSTATHILAFDELALDLSSYCSDGLSPVAARVKPELETLLIQYCSEPHLTDAEYKKLWRFATADLVPETEFQPWLDEMRSNASEPAPARFEMLFTTSMTSPWFIFKN